MPDLINAASDRLSHLLDKGIKLPPLPASGLDLMNILRQPVESLNVNRIGVLVENDPTLAANVLRVANSPMYGSARGVNRVHQAIVVMGLDETVQMLNYYLMRKLFPAIPEFAQFSAESFWQHAWGCATAARLMGQPQYLVHCLPGELYLAGLLHDIGKIVFAIYMTEEFSHCLEQAQTSATPLHLIEREIMGADHATVGAQLLDAWNLPSTILTAIGGHHEPESLDDNEREMAGLIELANALTHASGVGTSGNPAPTPAEATWLTRENKSPLVQANPDRGILRQISNQLELKAAEFRKKDEPAEEPTAQPAEQPVPNAIHAAASEAASNAGDAAAKTGSALATLNMSTLVTHAEQKTEPAPSGGFFGWVKKLLKAN